MNKSSGGALTPILRANQEEISQAAAAAHRDNDFVYHERLPDPRSLEAILAQPIAKPIPVSFPLTSDFKGSIFFSFRFFTTFFSFRSFCFVSSDRVEQCIERFQCKTC